MNKKDLIKSYETPPPPGNPREIEAWGLTQAALKLRDAMNDGDPEVIRSAIRINWQLWTILQGELLDPDCPLPDDLRANAISLSSFVDKQSLDLISSPEVSKIDILISINRELAAGLRTKPETGEKTVEPTDDQQASPIGDISA